MILSKCDISNKIRIFTKIKIQYIILLKNSLNPHTRKMIKKILAVASVVTIAIVYSAVVTSIMMSCKKDKVEFDLPNVLETNKQKPKYDLSHIVETNKPKVEMIMSDVKSGNNVIGLFKVQLDDSTTILFYRGYDCCTMIQLK